MTLNTGAGQGITGWGQLVGGAIRGGAAVRRVGEDVWGCWLLLKERAAWGTGSAAYWVLS